MQHMSKIKNTNNAITDLPKQTYSSRLDSMSSLSCRRLTFNLSRSFARPSANFSSSPTGFAQVSVETDANGIATVSMNKAPVNSLNTEFIQELTQAVVDTEKAAKVTFVDFSSNIKSCRPLCSPLETKCSARGSTSRRCTSPTKRGWRLSGEAFRISGLRLMDANCQ